MKIYLICLALLSSQAVHAQIDQYEFYPEINNIAVSSATSVMLPSAQQYANAVTQLNLVQQTAKNGINYNLTNYRTAYLDSSGYGRRIIAERIGNMGAQAFAKQANYTPLYVSSRGVGFDQVYKFGNQIIVMEAKGGSSGLRVYRGHLQGTPQYATAVAKAVLKSKTSTTQAKYAAELVLKAARDGRLVLQNSYTNHIQGKPGTTVVHSSYGQVKTYSLLHNVHNSSLAFGLLGGLLGGVFTYASELAKTDQDINWYNVANIGMLSSLSAYTGSMTGILSQQALVNNSLRLTRIVGASHIGSALGGIVTSGVFAGGYYLLGYTDLKTASRIMVVGAVGALASTTASAVTMTMVASFGTASTGAAISSLSGVAATNASLAWLGGGSLAAGGGGMAAGATVLTGGVALAAVAASAGILYLYNLSDANTEHRRVENNLLAVRRDLIN